MLPLALDAAPRKDVYGYLPLPYAAKNNNLDAIELLVDAYP